MIYLDSYFDSIIKKTLGQTVSKIDVDFKKRWKDQKEFPWAAVIKLFHKREKKKWDQAQLCSSNDLEMAKNDDYCVKLRDERGTVNQDT